MSLKLLSLANYKYQQGAIIMIMLIIKSGIILSVGSKKGASINQKQIRQRVGAEFPKRHGLDWRHLCWLRFFSQIYELF